MDIENTSILIGKVLSGNASDLENKSLTDWRNENKENEKFFNELKKSWDLGNSVYNKIDILYHFK